MPKLQWVDVYYSVIIEQMIYLEGAQSSSEMTVHVTFSAEEGGRVHETN